MHEGYTICHEGVRLMVRKTLRHGYYWPTMLKNASIFVQVCKPCQNYAPHINRPPVEFVSIPGAWPFAQWGIDLAGPVPRSTGQHKWIIVAIDYFSKSVEAKAFASITEFQVMKFLKSQVISQYGIPHVLLRNNGPQFWFLEELPIARRFASVRHAQTNRHVEVVNKVVLDGLKKRIDTMDSNWDDELESVSWVIQTTPKKSTCETPFFLVYVSEVVG